MLDVVFDCKLESGEFLEGSVQIHEFFIAINSVNCRLPDREQAGLSGKRVFFFIFALALVLAGLHSTIVVNSG